MIVKHGAKPVIMLLDLTEFDVEILLIALGKLQTEELNRDHSGRAAGVLIEKIYRKMGARIGSGKA